MKTLLCVISPICCKLSCYDDVGFFAKEKCEIQETKCEVNVKYIYVCMYVCMYIGYI